VEASLITLAMIGVVAMGWMSMLNASLLASGAMIFAGCLSLRTAARSIDWGTLVVIACAIGLESAVTRSGLAEQIAGLLTTIGGDNPHLALAVIFVGCSFMTNVITNNAAAAFMFPIALSTANQLGVSFMPFAITLMISASCAFITPTGYQTNLMVWGPGEYQFTDFVKIGTVITLIVAAMTIFLTPLIYSF
jgi:di/tricarboxylate transporter